MRTACAIALLLVATDTAGGPDAGVPAGNGADLSIVLVRAGSMTRVRIEGDRLVARNAGGAIIDEHPITTADRARLLRAARLAAADPSPQRACADDETFVSVTVDARTTSSAVCPQRNSWYANPQRWQALLALLRNLLPSKR